ncbi:hypothetical protein [Paraburkholderia terrae]
MSAGNKLSFYVPKPRSGAKAFPPKKQPHPEAFIKSNFDVTLSAPFGAKAPLVLSKEISRVSLLSAALECGYGGPAHWTSSLMLDPTQCAELGTYLGSRLDLLMTSIERVSQIWQPRSFYKKVEPSEKVALSFILGGIGAYLAAQAWLEAGGTSIKSFLHVGIYTKSSARASPLVSFALKSGKSPDFLVEGHHHGWHVFEAKGGQNTKRWARLCEGLAQLDALPPIGWSTGGSLYRAVTCVCVHTSIDPGDGVSITAVDPPSTDYDPDAPFLILEGVSQLLLMLEAIQQFNALSSDTPSDNDSLPEWKLSKATVAEDITIGIPSSLLYAEQTIRERLAVFLAVREFVERNPSRPSKQPFRTRLRRAVRERMRRDPADATFVRLDEQSLTATLQQFPDVFVPEEFLGACAKILGLDSLAQNLALHEEQRSLVTSITGAGGIVTSGGLLLFDTSSGQSDDEKLMEPSTSRG